MTGKLDINLGDDYAFDIRRARANAEGLVAVTGDGTTIGDPTTALNNISVQWKAAGVQHTFGFESAGESREEALALLATGAAASETILSATSDATTITLVAAASHSPITDVICAEAEVAP